MEFSYFDSVRQTDALIHQIKLFDFVFWPVAVLLTLSTDNRLNLQLHFDLVAQDLALFT